MSVVARMYVQEISQYAYNQAARTVKLQVVSRGEENKKWAAATPSGNAALTINNDAAGIQFELGKEYLVTFDLAPEVQ